MSRAVLLPGSCIFDGAPWNGHSSSRGISIPLRRLYRLGERNSKTRWTGRSLAADGGFLSQSTLTPVGLTSILARLQRIPQESRLRLGNNLQKKKTPASSWRGSPRSRLGWSKSAFRERPDRHPMRLAGSAKATDPLQANAVTVRLCSRLNTIAPAVSVNSAMMAKPHVPLSNSGCWTRRGMDDRSNTLATKEDSRHIIWRESSRSSRGLSDRIAG